MNNPFTVMKDWVAGNPVKEEEALPIVSSRNQEYYADITVVLDKSGSMGHMRQGVIEGFNGQFESMLKSPGGNRWTMVQFDDPGSARGAKEDFPHVVFEQRSEKDIKLLTPEDYQTRGGTALVDAVCKTIEAIDGRTSGQDNVKPIVMIMTDGEENSSREFTTEKMREMVAERQAKNWEFIYFGANQDSWGVAASHGLASVARSNNPYDAYCSSSSSSNATASGASQSFDWMNDTVGGALVGIASGMIGVNHIASGHVYNSNAAKSLDFTKPADSNNS